MKIFRYLAFSTLLAMSSSIAVGEIHRDGSRAWFVYDTKEAKYRIMSDEEYRQKFDEDMPLAMQGDSRAQADVGTMFEYGYGVAQNYVEAMKWYRLSAVQGNRDGQSGIGYMYWYGTGIVQDYVRAHMWYNISLDSEIRDKIAEKMTIEDVSKARAMATTCVNSGYEDCGW